MTVDNLPEPESYISSFMADYRRENRLTKQHFAEITGLTLADIRDLENGTRNPSLEMLKRLAAGMGMRLRLEFIPAE